MPKDKQPKQADSVSLPEIAFAPTFKAVLVADTVGYSRLMEADSVGTYQRFRSLRVNILDPLIVSYRGITVKNTGDGFICEFDVPGDAFLCVSELHQSLKEAQPGVSPSSEIVLRIGMHWGRVIHDADDVFGHAVNVAARLQEAAPPGGTVLSQEMLEKIDMPGGMTTADLGQLRLKNLEQPVAAALVGEPRSFAETFPSRYDRQATIPSIALLPFDNLTEATETRSLVAGFIDDINTSLSNLRDILTVSNGSTVGIDLTRWTRDQIVEKLGVQYLFSGRIRSHGLQWRLSVELTDATKNEVVWAEKYEILTDEIFDLQDEITLSIVRQIASHIQSQQVRKAMRKAPQNLTAYDYFLRALSLLYQLRPDNFEEAKNLLNNAIRDDSSFGAPYALLSHWHMFRVAEGWSDNPDAEIGQVMRAANRAIELDPSNALAHALLGQAKGLFEHDTMGARSSVDRARDLSPNNAWAWTFSSGPYGFSGDTQTAIRQAERGLRLSPLDQHVFFMQGLLAQNHYLHGNHLEGATWARRSLSANPRFGNAARVLIASLSALGDDHSAQKIVKHHKVLAPGFRLSEYRERCPFGREQSEIYVDRLRHAGVQY